MKLVDDGFTIIELLIATAIFSVILLLTAAAIIGISGTYIKGSVEDQTQQTARTILSDVSDDINFNYYSSVNATNLTTTSNNDIYYFCAGGDVYVYQLDKYLTTKYSGNEYTNWGLIRYASPSCPSSSSPPPNCLVSGSNPCTSPGNIAFPANSGYQELLSDNERLGQLYVAKVAGTNAYTISIVVGYGANDLLNDNGTLLVPGGSTVQASSYINGLSLTAPASDQYDYQCQSGADSSFCATSALTTIAVPRIVK